MQKFTPKPKRLIVTSVRLWRPAVGHMHRPVITTHEARFLYRFDADESSSTYATNYVISAICCLGVVLYLAKRPSAQSPPPPSARVQLSFPPTAALLTHLGLYGVVMFIGGLGHHVWFHRKCPGIEMPAGRNVSCPDGIVVTSSGGPGDSIMSAYLFFFGPAALNVALLAISLSGFTNKCISARAYTVIVIVCQVLGLAAGVAGASTDPDDAFFYLGALLMLNLLLASLCCVIGLCIEGGFVAGRLLIISASLIGVVGMIVQLSFVGVCGPAAYKVNGARDCPFRGDGVVGMNHNAVFHIIDAISKLVFSVALRYLTVAEVPEGGFTGPPTVMQTAVVVHAEPSVGLSSALRQSWQATAAGVERAG